MARFITMLFGGVLGLAVLSGCTGNTGLHPGAPDRPAQTSDGGGGGGGY